MEAMTIDARSCHLCLHKPTCQFQALVRAAPGIVRPVNGRGFIEMDDLAIVCGYYAPKVTVQKEETKP